MSLKPELVLITFAPEEVFNFLGCCCYLRFQSILLDIGFANSLVDLLFYCSFYRFSTFLNEISSIDSSLIWNGEITLASLSLVLRVAFEILSAIRSTSEGSFSISINSGIGSGCSVILRKLLMIGGFEGLIILKLEGRSRD
jgi:hypothetical protein